MNGLRNPGLTAPPASRAGLQGGTVALLGNRSKRNVRIELESPELEAANANGIE